MRDGVQKMTNASQFGPENFKGWRVGEIWCRSIKTTTSLLLLILSVYYTLFIIIIYLFIIIIVIIITLYYYFFSNTLGSKDPEG